MTDHAAPLTTITVQRSPGGYRDRMRAYKILIDNQAVGTVKPGESVTTAAAPGTHTVRMKVDWCSSPAITVIAAPGTDSAFFCEPGGSAAAALFSLFRPGSYISLKQLR